MSKTKKWLFAAFSLLIIGGIIFVIGMSVLDWDFYKLDTNEYEAKSYACAAPESVTRVEINVRSFPVTVQNGDTVSLDYYESTDSEVTVTQENGVLKIEEKHDYNFFRDSWFSFGRMKRKYVLTVTDGVEIDIKGANSDIKITGLRLPKVTVDSTNADLYLGDCTIDELNIDSTNADIVMSACEGTKMLVDSTNLDLELNYCAFDLGEVKGTNCDVVIKNCGFRTLNMRSTNADYECSRLTVDVLVLKGTNLDADIEIVGERSEYTIETHGHDLPREQSGTAPGKKILLDGTNCDVDLNFVS